MTTGPERPPQLEGGVPHSLSGEAPTSLHDLAPRILADAPRVLSDVPAAVLLIDLKTGAVTYANTRAQDLAPRADLPMSVAGWAEQAGLREPGGDTPGPLARIAEGGSVKGELAFMDARGDGRPARLLWVTGLPLDVDALAGSALVVMLDLDGLPAEIHDPDRDLRALRDRAVVATDISFTISDPSLPDNPLVWANPAFTRVTGYEFDDIVGRNCRLLQGPDTDPQAVAELRAAQKERRTTTVTLLNYRADGTAFWNEVSLSPVFDGGQQLTHFVGVQADVTARVHAEQEREAAYAAERAARAEAERARAAAEAAQVRLALLAEATTLLAATLDVDEAMERLVSLAVPVLGDWCVVDFIEDDTLSYRMAVAHVEPSGAELLRRADKRAPRYRNPATAAYRVMSGEDAILIPEVDDSYLSRFAHDDEQMEMYRAVSGLSMLVVPLRARRQTLGVMTVATTEASGRRLTEDDLALAKDLARRAALAVDNARLYTREHQLAETLQRSLLPALPNLPGLSLAARYVASAVGAQVGGDWYDVLGLPDGAVGLAVGDVMGHDLSAAAAMGQLRSVLRSYAFEGDAAPRVLDRLDRLVQGLEMAQLATAVYALLEPAGPGEPRVLRYANAGHLPPLLRLPDGSVTFLEEGQSVLLGAAEESERSEAAIELPPGSTIVLYTDGLVERRNAPLDQGLAWLAGIVRDCDVDADPEAVCDGVLEALHGDPLADDVALLAVRVEPDGVPASPEHDTISTP